MSGSSLNKPSIPAALAEDIIKFSNATKREISPKITPRELENITRAVLSNKESLSPAISKEQKEAIIKAVLESRQEILKMLENKSSDKSTMTKLASKLDELAKKTFESAKSPEEAVKPAITAIPNTRSNNTTVTLREEASTNDTKSHNKPR